MHLLSMRYSIFNYFQQTVDLFQRFKLIAMSITKEKLNKVVDAIIKDEAINRIEAFNTDETKSAEGINMRNPYTKEGQLDRLKFLHENAGADLQYIAGEKQFEGSGYLNYP